MNRTDIPRRPDAVNIETESPPIAEALPSIKFLNGVPLIPVGKLSEHFRDGHELKPYRVHFVMINGGMGDYICWMQSILYVATTCPWIYGTIAVPDYFHEFVRAFINSDTFPKWTICDYKELEERMNSGEGNGEPIKGPLYPQHLGINATGSHLLDCGFAYFAGQVPPPPGWDRMVRFDHTLLKMYLPSKFTLAPHSYAVITPNAVMANRRAPGKAWNPIIKRLKELGITPVFLGKSETLMNKVKMVAKSDDELTTEGVEDWRNKTTIMQAAAIMGNAAMVIGLDNGLLHLAACTWVPIVFGYTTVETRHRRPRRNHGITLDVVVDKEELKCIGCQSNTNMLLGFDFNAGCFYGDFKCIDLIFNNESSRWIDAVDYIVAEMRGVRPDEL